ESRLKDRDQGRKTWLFCDLKSGQRAAEVFDQIVDVFDADGQTQLVVAYAHLRTQLRTHLVIDRMRDGQDQAAVIAQVSRQHKNLQPVQKCEEIDIGIQLHRHQRAVAAAKQFSGTFVLRVV